MCPRPILIPFVILHGSAYGVTVPFMWYHQHCSSEEGSLTIFDNVVAYAISIVGLGCVVFFEEVQTTPPYNIICPLIASNALAYLLAKVACNRELILVRIKGLFFSQNHVSPFLSIFHLYPRNSNCFGPS